MVNKIKTPERSSFHRRGVLKAALAFGALVYMKGHQDVMASPKTSESLQENNEFAPEPSWEQDFTTMPDGPVDESVWRHELDPEVPGYNDELQAYTSSEENVRIEDGTLVLEAHRESYQYPNDALERQFEYTSGRIDTSESFGFEYGKIEASMRLPMEGGTWPAFWFLSSTQSFTDRLNPTDDDWAEPRFYLHNGELDAMEAYGKDPGLIEGTLHTFKNDPTFTTRIPVDDAFHTYSVEVSPDKVTWTLDGETFGEYEKPSDNPDEWPFGQGNRFYPILNLAMGSYGGEVGSEADSWRLEVRNLRFFDYQAA